MRNILKLLSVAFIVPAISWGASIKGQVLVGVPGTTGFNPLSGVPVTLISGAGSSAAIVDTTTTDDLGNYNFEFSIIGFMQVVATTTDIQGGYDPVTSVTVVAVNTDTASLTADISFISLGVESNDSGSSAIGGRLTSNGTSAPGLVTLRRRATSTSAWVTVATVESDANGVFLFSNILPAGIQTTINAYSLVVEAPGFATYTSGTLTVSPDNVLLANPQLITVALHSVASKSARNIRFSTVGDRLALELGSSNSARTVSVFNMTGALQHRVTVAAGESKANVPSAFSKGYLFQVK